MSTAVETLPTMLEMARMIDDLQARVAVLEGDQDPGKDRLGPFAKNSATSRAAALANLPRSGSQRARILQHYIGQGEHGATRQEVERDLGLLADAVRPRVCELIEGGWLRVTPETRLTPSGQDAEVLVATEKAHRENELKIEEVRGSSSPSPVVSGAPPVSSGAGPLEGAGTAGAPETTLFDPVLAAPPRGAYDEDPE